MATQTEYLEGYNMSKRWRKLVALVLEMTMSPSESERWMGKTMLRVMDTIEQEIPLG